ncbi:MAG: TetR/AcrR family transcriptional regulator [Pseudonocardia sp.]|nr:TetR/AcrR family transcriptional regulator [Pseudonocardia sp.]
MGNREALLEAAITCLRERGYARTTARDLVAVSGTNLGAINYHFRSKEALLNEAIAEGVRQWIEHLGGQLARHMSAEPGLPATMDDFFAELDASRPMVDGFFDALAQAGHVPELRAQLGAHYETFRADLATVLGVDDATASLLLALADGLIVQWQLDPTRTPDTDQILGALRTLTRRLGSRARSHD